MLYLSICVFDFEAGQVCQWPCSRRRHASGSARIASGRMCTFTAQAAALPPRASRPHPVWPTGAGLCFPQLRTSTPSLGWNLLRGSATLRSSCQPKASLLHPALATLVRWQRIRRWWGLYHGSPAWLPTWNPRPPPHLPSPFPASLFCLPCCLAHTMLVHGRMSLLPCALWTDSSFFLSSTLQIMFMSFFLQLPLVLSEIIYLCMYYI